MGIPRLVCGGYDELGWFELAGRSAPWGPVETSAKLVDADPRESGGLYDRALELWGHFANQKKSGVKGLRSICSESRSVSSP